MPASAEPPAVHTVTVTGPSIAGGDNTRSSVSDTTWMLSSDRTVSPNVTFESSKYCRFDPLITTTVPPTPGPDTVSSKSAVGGLT